MTKPLIEVEGAKELRRALKGVDGGIADLKSVNAAAATIVETRAGQLVPRLSGALASTLRSSGQARTGVVRAGRATVPYAGVIAFGWPAHNIRPQPFLYDALDDRRQEVIDLYGKRVGEIIKKNGL